MMPSENGKSMRPMADTEKGSEKAFPESLPPGERGKNASGNDAFTPRGKKEAAASGENPETGAFETVLRTHLPPEPLARLKKARIGIAGAGGLGSNVAQHLTRSGIGALVVADFDTVSASNLNRQFYFPDQIGQPKVEALKANLLRIHPQLVFTGHALRLDRETLLSVFQDCDLVVEALDEAKTKALFVETLAAKGIPLVAASGIGGYGAPDSLSVRRFGRNLVVVGDGRTPSDTRIPPMSPRVGIAAAMQADLVLFHLIGTLISTEDMP
jgi:sulfur carrier protein ThiS adenylyltransferase